MDSSVTTGVSFLAASLPRASVPLQATDSPEWLKDRIANAEPGQQLTILSEASPHDLSPSVVVETQAAVKVDDLKLYEPVPTKKELRFSSQSIEGSAEHSIDSEISSALNGFNDSSRWGRTALSLGSLINQGISEYHQYAEQSISSSKLELGTLEIDDRKTFEVNKQAELTLVLTTKDGDQISFSFSLQSGKAEFEDGGYSFQEIVVDFSVDGELSEEERASISQFSEQLHTFARDFFIKPDETPDLSSLKLFSDDTIAGLELSLQGSDASFNLSVSETEDARSIDISWKNNESAWANGSKVGRSTNTLQLLIDKHRTTEGSNVKKDLALSQQQQIIRESLTDAKASRQQQGYIASAFDAINQDLYFIPEQGNENMVTGLADYNLSFKGEVLLPMQSDKIKGGNEISRLSEGIKNFELSQATQIKDSGESVSITQQQDMKLDASYFMALPHLENPDFANQSFIHHSLDIESQIVSEQYLEGLEMISASITQKFERNETINEYNEGKLVDSRKDSKVINEAMETAASIRQGLNQQQALAMVDELFMASAFDN
jgi:hypothetical protein